MKVSKIFGWFLAGLTVVVAAAGEGAEEDAVVHSTSKDRIQTDLTVYNHDLALVREVRQLDLPDGRFDLEFQDVPARINPVTLLIEDRGRTKLAVLEQNYEFDLMSRQKILHKYVGRQVSWLQENGGRINGRLLGMAEGPVYEVDGEVVFEVPGRLALPDLPEDLRAIPTLVWDVQTRKAGTAELDVSYLSSGVSWHADYVLQLDETGQSAKLQAWVTVENNSGSAFKDANLMLVAGDLNRVRQRVEKDLMAVSMARAPEAAGFVEETLYDYHLYTLERPTTLLDRQIKQIGLLEAHDIQIEKQYRLDGHLTGYRPAGRPSGTDKVTVSYRFENTRGNSLNVPLPAGVFRVYGRSQSGSRQLLGEDRIDHTPKQELIELEVGKAFDIVAKRTLIRSERVADKVTRSSFEVLLKNQRQEDVVVEVIESVRGDWTVTQSSLPSKRISAGALGFDVPVKSGQETKLTFTIEVKH